MAVELRLTRRFQKSFEALDDKTQSQIKQALEKLAENPHLGKRLRGELAGEWSLRVGRYRVLYTLAKAIAWLETVKHRREVYRKR